MTVQVVKRFTYKTREATPAWTSAATRGERRRGSVVRVETGLEW
jgi:hypothetical protein